MICLYIKTHNITGLRYFGKTTRKNINSYCGSGIYWQKHLKKHGKDFSTEVVGMFEKEEEVKQFAIAFSNINNIIESKEWANLKEENGLDGNPCGVKFTDEHKEKIRQSRLGKCFNDFDELTRQKMSNASKGKIQKQIENGTHIFSGEKGRLLASNRNKKLVTTGKHNFQNFITTIDKSGNKCIIAKEQYRSQTGERQDWEYVQITSNEAKQRLKTAKEIVK
jgi:hypothetical protein